MASLEQVHKAYQNAKLAGDIEAADRLQAILYEGMGVSPPKKFEPIPEKSGVIGNTLKGFGAGAVGTLESAALGAATILDEEAELKAREKIQSVADKFTPEGGDKDSKAYNVGSGLGSIVGTGAATLVGGAVGGAKGAVAAGTAAGVGVQVGEASERARAAGATQEQRNRAITNPMIIGAGLLETIPYLKAVGKFSKPTANKLSKMLGGDKELKGLLDRARSAGTTGGVEALQELAQNTAQNLVEQGYNPDRELTEGAAASAGYGGATGAIYQLLIDVLPGRQRGVTPKRDAPPRTEEDVQDVQEEISEEDIEREQAELFGEDGQGELFPQTTLDRRNAAARREDEAKLADDAETKEIEAMLAEDERAKKQIDIDEVIDKDKKDEAAAEKDAAETEEVEALLAEDAGVEAEATAEEALKELPATDRRVQEGREKRTAETRKRILDETLGNVNVNDYADPVKGLTAKFIRTAKAEGITAVEPTQAEISAIQKEVKELQKLQQTSGDPLATGDTARGTTTTARPSARTEPARSRASVQDDTKDVGRESGVQKPAAVTKPRAGRLERTSPSPVVPTVGTAASQPTLMQAVASARKTKGKRVPLPTTTSPVSTNVPAPGPATTTTAPKRATTKPKVKAKAKAKAVPTTTTTTPKPATGPMGAAAQMEEIRKTGYRDEVPDSQNPVTDADRQAVKASKNRNVATYLGAAPDPVDGILDAINDVVLETPTTKVAKDDSLDPDVRKLQKGRSKDAASDALKEAKKIMSPEVGKFIDKKLAEKQKELETKPPISKQQSDIDLAEQRKNRKRKIEDREAQEEVLNQAQFEKAKKELIKQTGRKTATKKQVVEYMRVTDRFKKFATLPPEPKKSKAQKEVDEVVETLEEIEVYDAINDVAAAELGIDLNIDGLPYIAEDVEALGIDLSPEITALLKAGNLKEALVEVAKLKDISPRAKAIAEGLADYVGDTKVFVNDGRVRNPLSRAFAAEEKRLNEKYGKKGKLRGLFLDVEGAPNTIVLAPSGLTVHTLLHEMTHAATVKTLENKGHPVTKQLTNLHKQVKKDLPSVYGSTNVEEFVAEAFSNPEFQTELASMYKKDMTLSVWQRFANAINNLVNSLLKKPSSKLYKGDDASTSALTKADALILQILQPPVDGMGSGVTLAHMSTKEGVQKVMGNLGKIGKKFKPMTKADGSKFGDSAIDFITDSPRKFGNTSIRACAYASCS
jgi:hypothetical protein